MNATEAMALVKKYNKDAYHIEHARAVGDVLAHFAETIDPDRIEYWRAVGILHDVDYELHPDRHCIAGEEILRAEGVEEEMIRSAMSHGWAMTGTPHEPESEMDRVLYATDELTGIIFAAKQMRPSRSTLDMNLKSVKKKFKDRKFAAGCDRDLIERGAALLGMEIDVLLAMTLAGMQKGEAARAENTTDI